MSDGVQMTLIICIAIVCTLWILAEYGSNSNDKKK